MAEFADALAANRPSPAGVAACAVSAALGASIILKVLTISGKGPQALGRLRGLEGQLRRAADNDAAIVRRLLEERDRSAMQDAIAIPLSAARAAVEALELSAPVAPELTGHLAADLAAGRSLLEGAVRGIVACVEANLRMAPDPVAAAEVRAVGERATLAAKTAQ